MGQWQGTYTRTPQIHLFIHLILEAASIQFRIPHSHRYHFDIFYLFYSSFILKVSWFRVILCLWYMHSLPSWETWFGNWDTGWMRSPLLNDTRSIRAYQEICHWNGHKVSVKFWSTVKCIVLFPEGAKCKNALVLCKMKVKVNKHPRKESILLIVNC